MCTIEQALPYIAIAVLCPAAYEGMMRAKFRELVGVSSRISRPHSDSDQQDQQSKK